MGCVVSENFVLLINGLPTRTFSASGGLHQGCHLSPLLFLLIVEGFNLLITNAKKRGLNKGVSITSVMAMAHLVFVDDVVLFGRVNL